ncbi:MULTISPECIES: S8 family serine peptidase [unclassified Variovorax]|uniref:S8 family peptidase n=1 Tax=unclassified Variovorax TaxID=663243 RepID=UPI00076CB552|nr:MULTISPECIES: S8 family serine peptidase [unclassified Variovorax]KWT70830.1 putative proteinase [Variovorax sp. WDL1]PNG49196.1 Subtilisin DY [Variovorax sp. B2]PNG49581.1 Subtilisin DY [Variovorax sp. B4]VTV18755.1 Subtilisin DY [Variovorax sp. WDL1]
MATVQRFILLPPRGTTTAAFPGNAHVSTFMRTLTVAPRRSAANKNLRVIDSTHENGIKLVEMTPEGVMALRQEEPGVRIVPEVFYDVARAPRPQLLSRAKTSSGAAPALSQLSLVVERSGSPVAGALVVAFTDYANQIGDQGTTRANGSVSLKVGARARIERLYVYPLQGCWPMVFRNVQLPSSTPFELPAIDFNKPDALQHFRGSNPGGDGAQVVVGIVDTGCGPHPDLAVAGGLNTVIGENPADFGDNGDQHGTHVAGIVASSGAAPSAMAGIAPTVSLRSYRVFPRGRSASNYSIAKAIDAAVSDGCDLINLSLGSQGLADPATSSAIADARGAGVAVFCASGNDGLPSVSQPAADQRAVAVGCFGRKGSSPRNSVADGSLGRASTLDKANRMATFSNHGVEIDMAGPGVGIISTVPGGNWAVMDGTSMACPAVVGMVSRLLSANAAVRTMARDQARSDAILKLAFQAARKLGFGPQYEGNGWIA